MHALRQLWSAVTVTHITQANRIASFVFRDVLRQLTIELAECMKTSNDGCKSEKSSRNKEKQHASLWPVRRRRSHHYKHPAPMTVPSVHCLSWLLLSSRRLTRQHHSVFKVWEGNDRCCSHHAYTHTHTYIYRHRGVTPKHFCSALVLKRLHLFWFFNLFLKRRLCDIQCDTKHI